MIIKIDSDLAKAVFLKFENGPKIEFQFPPKVSSDNRKGNWQDDEGVGNEPTVTYRSTSARAITLNITYINDGIWNCKKIGDQVRNMRGYFQRIKRSEEQRNLVVEIQLWCIGGKKPMTARLKSCDVKYSETMIVENSGFNTAWPLRTDIILDLALWTKDGNQDLEPLLPEITPDWY